MHHRMRKTLDKNQQLAGLELSPLRYGYQYQREDHQVVNIPRTLPRFRESEVQLR